MKATRAVALLIGAAFIAVVGYYEGRKFLADREVERLCAMDGGIKVYERVSLSADRFDKFGAVKVPIKARAKAGDEFFYEWDITYYRNGDPSMWRSHFKLFRQSDGKLLGEAIGYLRRGGDLPGPWNDSSLRCPKDADISLLEQRVFTQSTQGRTQ